MRRAPLFARVAALGRAWPCGPRAAPPRQRGPRRGGCHGSTAARLVHCAPCRRLRVLGRLLMRAAAPARIKALRSFAALECSELAGTVAAAGRLGGAPASPPNGEQSALRSRFFLCSGTVVGISFNQQHKPYPPFTPFTASASPSSNVWSSLSGFSSDGSIPQNLVIGLFQHCGMYGLYPPGVTSLDSADGEQLGRVAQPNAGCAARVIACQPWHAACMTG
jgi:hypothetical protein